MRPCRARWTASGPAAEPVAASSGTPPPGANILVFQREPEPAKQLNPIVGPKRASAAVSGASRATSSSLPSAT